MLEASEDENVMCSSSNEPNAKDSTIEVVLDEEISSETLKQNLQGVNNTESTTSKTTNQTSIDILNDDCLHRIFMELPMADRMRVERVCKKWLNVSQQGWFDIKILELTTSIHISKSVTKADNSTEIVLSKYKWTVGFPHLQIFQGFPNRNLHEGLIDNRTVEKLLLRCGRFLIRLLLRARKHDWNREILPFIEEHCYNLKELIIDLEDFPETEISKLFSRFQKLNYVEMKELGKEFRGDCLKILPKESITEIHLESKFERMTYRRLALSAVETLRNFCNLHTLKLGQFVLWKEDLRPITENPTLTHVSLTNCMLADSIMLLGNLSHLKHLNLSSVPQVSDEFLGHLATNCSQLQYLDITNCTEVSDDGIAEIARLPRIETLLINRVYHVSDDNLGRLASLKVLYCEMCSNVRDPGIVALIENAPNLEYLGLLYTNVTAVALEAANRVTHLRNNGLELKMFVKSSILKDYDDDDDPSPLLNIETQYPFDKSDDSDSEESHDHDNSEESDDHDYVNSDEDSNDNDDEH